MFWESFLGLSLVKLLLIPAYRSTDFEVHRNWLAITHSLPLKKWYTDTTSEWTLDYPPFFAYFEWMLSLFAKGFDQNMLKVNNLSYASTETIVFLRVSVICADLVLALGVRRCGGEYLAILGNVGLLLVDHIHFQYNGFLFGFLFLSLGAAMKKRHLEAGFWFAVLCNFKHIFAYFAPAYVVFLFRAYCYKNGKISIKNLLLLGGIVLTVCGISFGPFIYYGQFLIVLQRLFPFKRGLVHAYWAPNFWALYNFVDKLISLAFKIPTKSSMTAGLVREYDHTALPSVSPSMTLVITIFSMIPALIKLWNLRNDVKGFISGLVLCGWSSFLFGWHVHEKAILLVILPLALLAYNDRKYRKAYTIIAITGHFSLFPLLYEAQETWIKITTFGCHSAYTFYSLYGNSNLANKKNRASVLLTTEKMYLLGLSGVFLFEVMIFKLIGSLQKYEFLPLLLYSVYCAVGTTYSWVLMYKIYLFS